MRVSLLLLALVLVAAPVRADDLAARSAPAPVVATYGLASPGSLALARPSGFLPASLFDPSRFTISNSLVFGYSSGGGYGSYGGGTSGLFTSSLGYQVGATSRLQVSLGAYTNPAFGARSQQGVFLQGAAFDWQPSRNALFRIEYRDVRSPLQYGAGPWAPYGYGHPYGDARRPVAPFEPRAEDDEIRRN